MKWVLIAIALSCAACESSRREEPRAAPRHDASAGVSRLADQSSEEDVRGCTTDADCVLSCRIDGECCPDPCACTQAYRKSFATALEQHQKGCILAGCPKAKCADTGFDYVPVCRDSRCTSEQRARTP